MTVSTQAASASAEASTATIPRARADAITHATWRAWTSRRYGKFTVKPDCAMLSTKQFRETANMRAMKGPDTVGPFLGERESVATDHLKTRAS